MQINLKNLASMAEANQNFSRVAKLAHDQMVEDVAKQILAKHAKAFEELAK